MKNPVVSFRYEGKLSGLVPAAQAAADAKKAERLARQTKRRTMSALTAFHS